MDSALAKLSLVACTVLSGFHSDCPINTDLLSPIALQIVVEYSILPREEPNTATMTWAWVKSGGKALKTCYAIVSLAPNTEQFTKAVTRCFESLLWTFATRGKTKNRGLLLWYRSDSGKSCVQMQGLQISTCNSTNMEWWVAYCEYRYLHELIA